MLEGSCLCGSIRYQMSGFVLGCHACHCASCKKFSGSSNSTVMIGTASGLEWLQGQSSLTIYESETPNPRAFCRTCGSPMPSVSETGMAVIPAGSLDEDPQLSLGYHIHTRGLASWEPSYAERAYEDTLPPEAALEIWEEIGERQGLVEHDLTEFMLICDRNPGFRDWWKTHSDAFGSHMLRAMEKAQRMNDTALAE